MAGLLRGCHIAVLVGVVELDAADRRGQSEREKMGRDLSMSMSIGIAFGEEFGRTFFLYAGELSFNGLCGD